MYIEEEREYLDGKIIRSDDLVIFENGDDEVVAELIATAIVEMGEIPKGELNIDMMDSFGQNQEITVLFDEYKSLTKEEIYKKIKHEEWEIEVLEEFLKEVEKW